MVSQRWAKLMIVAMQIERDRLEKGLGKRSGLVVEYNLAIKYIRKQLKEAETPTEIDELIHKIATW